MSEELLIYIAAKLARLDASVTALYGLLNARLNQEETREAYRKLANDLAASQLDYLCQQFPELEKALREQSELQARSDSEGLRERGPGSA